MTVVTNCTLPFLVEEDVKKVNCYNKECRV